MDAQFWNEAYEHEARNIAATVLDARGYRWKANEVARRRRSDNCEELQLVMLALMVARGDCQIKEYVPI